MEFRFLFWAKELVLNGLLATVVPAHALEKGTSPTALITGEVAEESESCTYTRTFSWTVKPSDGPLSASLATLTMQRAKDTL